MPSSLAVGAAEALGAGFWLILAAVLAIAGFYIGAAVRRWSRRQVGRPPFTLAELRDLRARGQITEAEFAALRQALLEQARIATDSTVERQRSQSG